MENLIKQIDFFPYKFTQPMLGENAYKTFHGGVISILALMLAVCCFILFGQDFINKQNPASFYQKVKIPRDNLVSIPLKNSEFSFMFKFENTATENFEEKDIFLEATAIFFEYINETEGTYKLLKKRRFKTAPCLQTTNKDNPLNSNVDLSKWTCVDFDDYRQRYNDETFFTGNWTDAKKIQSIDIEFNTCRFDFEKNDFDRSNCAKYDRIQKLTTENNYFLSFLAPQVNIDVQNFSSPLTEFYKYFWYRLRANAGGRRGLFFEFVELQDDRGWILEDLSFQSGLSLAERNEDSFVITNEQVDSGNVLYSKMVFYMNDASVVHFRSYVKLQQVMANIGGILKVITLIFTFCSNLVSSRLFSIEMVSKFYCYDASNSTLVIKPSLNSDDSQRSVGSVKPFKGKKIKSVIGGFASFKVALNLAFGFRKELFSQIWSKGEKIKEEADVMRQIDSYLENKDKNILKTKKQF